MPKGTINIQAVICVVTQHSSPKSVYFFLHRLQKKKCKERCVTTSGGEGAVLDQYFGIGDPGGLKP